MANLITLCRTVSTNRNVRGIDLLPSDLLLLGSDILEGLEGKEETSTLSEATSNIIRDSGEDTEKDSRRPDDELLLEYFGHVEELETLFGMCKTFKTTGDP